MRLQSLVEVVHANDSIYNGENKQHDGDDRKGRERLANSEIGPGARWLVNPHQLEDEVAETAEK